MKKPTFAREGAINMADQHSRRRHEVSEHPERNKGNRSLLLLAGLGIGALLVICVPCTGVGLYLVFRAQPDDRNINAPRANIARADLDKIESAMTLGQVNAILGPGRLATAADMRAAFNENRPVPISATDSWKRNAEIVGVEAWHQWRNGDESIFVGFAKGKKTGKERALISFWVKRLDDGFQANPGLLPLFRIDDPDAIAEEKGAEEKLINDPKFKNGDAKKLIVGRWADEIKHGWEFRANGTFHERSPGGDPGDYRFTAPDQIELSYKPDWPGVAPGTVHHVKSFKVLVSEDTLILRRLPGEGLTQVYKRTE